MSKKTTSHSSPEQISSSFVSNAAQGKAALSGSDLFANADFSLDLEDILNQGIDALGCKVQVETAKVQQSKSPAPSVLPVVKSAEAVTTPSKSSVLPTRSALFETMEASEADLICDDLTASDEQSSQPADYSETSVVPPVLSSDRQTFAPSLFDTINADATIIPPRIFPGSQPSPSQPTLDPFKTINADATIIPPRIFPGSQPSPSQPTLDLFKTINANATIIPPRIFPGSQPSPSQPTLDPFKTINADATIIPPHIESDVQSPSTVINPFQKLHTGSSVLLPPRDEPTPQPQIPVPHSVPTLNGDATFISHASKKTEYPKSVSEAFQTLRGDVAVSSLLEQSQFTDHNSPNLPSKSVPKIQVIRGEGSLRSTALDIDPKIQVIRGPHFSLTDHKQPDPILADDLDTSVYSAITPNSPLPQAEFSHQDLDMGTQDGASPHSPLPHTVFSDVDSNTDFQNLIPPPLPNRETMITQDDVPAPKIIFPDEDLHTDDHNLLSQSVRESILPDEDLHTDEHDLISSSPAHNLSDMEHIEIQADTPSDLDAVLHNHGDNALSKSAYIPNRKLTTSSYIAIFFFIIAVLAVCSFWLYYFFRK
jgi:hypothetical protein